MGLRFSAVDVAYRLNAPRQRSSVFAQKIDDGVHGPHRRLGQGGYIERTNRQSGHGRRARLIGAKSY